MTKNRFSIIADLLFIILIGLTPLLWFPQGYMVTSNDAAYPINILENFVSRFFAWNSQEPFGRNVSFGMGSIMVAVVEATYKYIGFSLYDAQKLTFVFWFLAMGLSMYYFAYSFRKVFVYRFFSLFATILYVFNFYLLALWRLGAGTTFAAYTALPLISSFFIRAILGDLSVVKSSVLIALVMFIFSAGGGLSIPLFGGLLIIVTVATIFFSVIGLNQGGIKIIVRAGKIGLLTVLITLLVNAYWFLPFFSFGLIHYQADVATQVVLSGAKAWTDSVSGYTSMLNLFRLQGFPDWYGNFAHAYANYYLTNPLLIFLSFLFAPLAYLSLLLAKEKQEKKMILLFVIISLVSLFFSAGTHKPTGYLLGLMLEHIPGFSIFRSTQYKFVPALYFSFAILISFTINYLIENVKLKKLLFLKTIFSIKRFLFLCSFLFIILYHFPFFGQSFFVWSKPLTTLLKIPNYVFNFQDWSAKNLTNEQRLFILPKLNTTWNVEIYNWDFFSPLSLINLVTDKPIMENLAGLEDREMVYVNRMYGEILNNNHNSILSKLTSFLQTPYALYRGDSDFTLNWVPAENPTNYLAALKNNIDIKQVWQNGLWQVFQLPVDQNFSGKIYGLNSLTEYFGGNNNIFGPILNDSNNFVDNSDIKGIYNTNLRAKLPIKAKIYAVDCASCILESENTPPIVSSVRILPGSVLYLLKEWREKKLEDPKLDRQVIFGNQLGLSVIRLTELNNLSILNRKDELIGETSDKLISNWDYIEKYLYDNRKNEIPDFNLIKTTEDYLIYEQTTVLDKYNSNISSTSEKSSVFIRDKLAKIIKKINTSSELIKQYISKNNWSQDKFYTLPENLGKAEIYLDALSLGNLPDKSLRVPNSMEIGNKIVTIKPEINGEKISLGTFNLSGVKFLKLIFPPAVNLLSNIRLTTDNYPTWGQQCFAGDVTDFSWQKNYKIILKTSNNLPTDTNFYLRKQRVNLSAENIAMMSYTKPDLMFNLKEQTEENIQIFFFSGMEGDYGATLLLCSKQKSDSSKLIQELMVEEVIAPSIYLVPTAQQISNSTVQKITFQRVNSTKYLMESSEIPPFPILVFNERFNSGWRLYDKDGENDGLRPWNINFWFDKPEFDNNHFRIFGFANAWYIDKPIKGNLILEFYPQKLFYRGIVVTMLSISLLMIAFLTIKIRKRKIL